MASKSASWPARPTPPKPSTCGARCGKRSCPSCKPGTRALFHECGRCWGRHLCFPGSNRRKGRMKACSGTAPPSDEHPKRLALADEVDGFAGPQCDPKNVGEHPGPEGISVYDWGS